MSPEVADAGPLVVEVVQNGDLKAMGVAPKQQRKRLIFNGGVRVAAARVNDILQRKWCDKDESRPLGRWRRRLRPAITLGEGRPARSSETGANRGAAHRRRFKAVAARGRSSRAS